MTDGLLPCPFCGCEVELVDREALFVFSCPSHSPCIGVGFATYGKQDQRETAIAAWNTRQPTQSDALRKAVIEECAKALEADAKLCDCAALEERECACGAWDDYKSITSDRAVEIVRALQEQGK